MSRSGDTVVMDASAQHIDQITDIYAKFVRDSIATVELEPPTRETMQERYKMLQAQEMPYLVACIGDQVIGWSYASRFGERSGYNLTVESSTYVHPDYHRHGVARLLLNELITRCTAFGKKQMVAATTGDGIENAASIALHNSLGFKQVGVLKEVAFKFGRFIDVTYLQRKL